MVFSGTGVTFGRAPAYHRAMPRRYRVKRGDCIASIAYASGLLPQTVWQHAGNRRLRETRHTPGVLSEGDEVVIPDVRTKTVDCETDKKHVFRRKAVPERLHVRLLVSGEPRRNVPFTLEVDGQPPQVSETDGEGWVRAWIPPGAKRGVLRIGQGEREQAELECYELELGGLEPTDEKDGIAARLRALGYLDGSNGDDPVALAQAIADFCHRNQIDIERQSEEAFHRELRKQFGA
jgi:hypothetical protein